MNRVAGIETEYGCLVNSTESPGTPDSWPIRVKSHIFKKARLGVLDMHYRDYEEPPGNGGFLLNGGRIYVDMGHLEYASPECRSIADIVAYDVAGDLIVQSAVEAMRATDRVAFLKNNIDHVTGATFGCHENYLMRRDAQFTPAVIGTLLSFLATRQIFTGAGRVGQANPLAFEFGLPDEGEPVDFQISQRADHIVNDIYQWVQFNRAIINARDEPLADFRKYRRLHLLLGDSNMSPYATALKMGTTAVVLTLLEERLLPRDVIVADAVTATREISRACDVRAEVLLENGHRRSALEVQIAFLDHARKHLRGSDADTDWALENWASTLNALDADKPELLIGGVDWISKKWLLEMFREKENLAWDDPWLQSLDLEYHNIDSEKGLFFALSPAKQIAEFNALARRPETTRVPPSDTRARGRGEAVAIFQKSRTPYLINWDSIATENETHLAMPDPFETYSDDVAAL